MTTSFTETAGRAGEAPVAQKGGLGPVALDKAAERPVDLVGVTPGRTMEPPAARAWAVKPPGRRMASIIGGFQ